MSMVLPTRCRRFGENFEMRNRQDDAEDEDGNAITSCVELFQYSLPPTTNTKPLITRIDMGPAFLFLAKS